MVANGDNADNDRKIRPLTGVKEKLLAELRAEKGAADPGGAKGKRAASARPKKGKLGVGKGGDGGTNGKGRTFPRLDEWEIAEHVHRNNLGRVVYDENEPHVYDDQMGIWEPRDEREIRRAIGECLAGSTLYQGEDKPPKPIKTTARLISGVIDCLESQTARPGFFADEKPGVAFRNGFLALDGKRVERREPSPESRCRFALPFDHDPDARCPRWLESLRLAFSDRDDGDEVIDLLAEFVGALLFGVAPTYQKALILVGQPNAGKSTICDVLKAMVPGWALSAIPPQKMGERFGLASLPGKRANIVNETPKGRVVNGELFKAVVTGDAIDVEQKNKDSFSYEPKAAHLFAANPPLPEVPGADAAFWRRWIVVEFNRVIPEDERNPNFASEIVEAEAAGVVNWAIEGVERLVERESYAIPTSCADALEQWRGDADSVARWARECLESVEKAVDGEKITDLHRAYRDWHEGCGGKPVARREFKARLRTTGAFIIGKGPNGRDRWSVRTRGGQL